MATALHDSAMIKCPICLEQFKEPRKMPTCAHSFCEVCMIAYVSEQLNESDRGIMCPVCRTMNTAPQDEGEIQNWVMSLEQDENILLKVQGNAKELKIKGMCGSCSVYGISSKASRLCMDCFDNFCLPCSMGRHSGEAYSCHKIIHVDPSGDNMNKVADIEEFRPLKEHSACPIHANKQVEYYCKDDESVCCRDCLAIRHRKCTDVIEVKGSAAENEAKADTEKIKADISKLTIFAKRLLENRKKAVNACKNSSEAMITSIQDIRAKVNKILDALEETISGQVKALAKRTSMTADEEKESLNNVIGSLTASLSLTEKAIKYVSPTHLFAICQTLKKKMAQYEATILDLYDSFEYSYPELEVQAVLQQLLDIAPNEISKLAIIKNREEPPPLPKYKEDDLLKTYELTKTNETSVRTNYMVKYRPIYSDVTFLPNGAAVFVDNNNGYICLTNKQYEVIASCNLSPTKDYSKAPEFCTYIGGRKIAVSAPYQSKIYILSADLELKVVRELRTNYKPQAIHSLQNGDIAVAWSNPVAFGIISDDETPKEKAYFRTDKSKRELKSFNYMAVDEIRKHVIQPCNMGGAVYCFDFEGYPKFKYKERGFTSPKGVALDGDGNIYICCRKYCFLHSNSIHVISPIGRGLRLVEYSDGIEPLAIAFKKDGKEFAATQFGDTRIISFFKLQKQ